MTLPPILESVAFPVIGAPLFIVSNPRELVARLKREYAAARLPHREIAVAAA